MSGHETVRVLVLHGDPLVSAGLSSTLRVEPQFSLATTDCHANVVIADYERGLAFAAAMKRYPIITGTPKPCVLILTGRDSESEIRYALENGARGYLIQGCGLDELTEAVLTLNRGLRYLGAMAARRLADSVASEELTGREMDVLRLIVEGHPNKVIASRLAIALGTVKAHVKGIFQKLGASTRTEVAAIADRRGLLMLPSRESPPPEPGQGRHSVFLSDRTVFARASFLNA